MIMSQTGFTDEHVHATGLQIQPGPDQRPRLDITVKLRLGSVLDLTDPARTVRAALAALAAPSSGLMPGWQASESASLSELLACAVAGWRTALSAR